jgi:Lar family restriction alleviation protein
MSKVEQVDEALKPCPFCGATGALIDKSTKGDAGTAYVSCKGCFAVTAYFYGPDAPGIRAAAAWNRRAPAPEVAAQRAEVERLREALTFYAEQWRQNMIGDGEEAHLTHWFTEPTEELARDAGDKARAALAQGGVK